MHLETQLLEEHFRVLRHELGYALAISAIIERIVITVEVVVYLVLLDAKGNGYFVELEEFVRWYLRHDAKLRKNSI